VDPRADLDIRYYHHKRNLTNNIGGGAEKLTMGIRNFIYKGIKFEGGENWFSFGQVFHFLFLSIFYLPLFNSVTKKLFLG
jgi:hypothetical protein